MYSNEETKIVYIFWSFMVLLGIAVVLGLMFGMPVYNVWSREMNGKAELAEATWNRQIQVEEAQANLESEKLNAQSEVERAKGMAEAIKIEGGNLTPDYIRYLWVRQQVNLNDKTVIYLPTEAGLPVLEANRLNDITRTKSIF